MTEQATVPVDTREMNAVHSFFRRELRLAGGLVRAVRPGDTARARVVADHLDLVGRCLHDHHTTEDDLLWPVMLQRVPEELAPIVHLMESQHERVDALLTEVAAVLPRWRASAGRAARDHLGEVYDRLFVHLAEHLDAEEERLLPLAARALTLEEWRAIGETSRSKNRRSETMLVLGMIAHDGDPDAVARMLADAPPPVRWLLLRLSRRAFRRHALRVHGTAAP